MSEIVNDVTMSVASVN